MSACIRCGAFTNDKLLPLDLPGCRACEHVWQLEDSCTVAVICAHLGISERPEDFTQANAERFVAELLKRTEAWALAWRAAA